MCECLGGKLLTRLDDRPAKKRRPHRDALFIRRVPVEDPILFSTYSASIGSCATSAAAVRRYWLSGPKPYFTGFFEMRAAATIIGT